MAKTFTTDALKTVLDAHRKWLQGEGGERADLRGADLRGAILSEADLSEAILRGADLSGADLSGAILSTGESWETYLAESVPELCRAGGVPLDLVSASWECHEWSNCPMHVAFGAGGLDDVPALFRPRVEQFIQLFDAGLIPPLRFDGDRWTCLPLRETASPATAE